MRIISGKYGGQYLRPPAGLPVRPTTDMARLAMFNILASELDWEQTDVLDLFSGTGGISFECLSRGARSVVSIDIHAACIRYQHEVSKKLQVQNFKAIRLDVFRLLKKNKGENYSFIFADPPYSNAFIHELPELILTGEWLRKNGLLILEHPGSISFTKHRAYVEQRTYGSVNFTFFKTPTS